MEERKVVKKRTVVEREDPVAEDVTNVNIGPDGSAQVQQEGEVIDEPVTSTTVRQETTVEERRAP